MHREPHMTDHSNVQHTIGPGPASFSPDPSQHTARADGFGRPDAPRTWRKPPHILWRKVRAVFIPVGDEDDSLYGYAREPAPSGWMYGAAIVLALFALICATLSSGLFSKRDDAVALALQSAEGTITSAAPSSSLRQSLSSSLLKAMPSAPSKPLSDAASPSASHTLSAGGQIAGQVAGQVRPEARIAPKQNVAATPAVPHPRTQADLQVVRASMDKNNLTTARAVLSRVLAEQPNNIDAIKLNADLEDRELKRNALLLAARGCAEQDQWNCVWRNAGNALVTDASSAEAKRLVTQAMWQSELNSRTGATPPLGISRAP
jgi:hypothetical protein